MLRKIALQVVLLCGLGISIEAKALETQPTSVNEKKQSGNAISFRTMGGRLGDELLDYAHAKWLSYKWGIPLLLRPFEYSDQLVLSDVEEILTPEKSLKYQHVNISQLSQLDDSTAEKTLFFVRHCPDSIDEYHQLGWRSLYIDVDWSDQKFLSMMRELIRPKHSLKLIKPPKKIVSVALHYRHGGGYDSDNKKKKMPLRFPENEFYFEQLKTLYQMVGESPLYVYIFTDYSNPLEIKKLFKKQFPSPFIRFYCRQSGNKHDQNVLEDLFSLMNFDCLIRPTSHFSITASHLGNFKIELFPKKGRWINDKTKFEIYDVNIIQKASWDPNKKQWISP